MARITQNFSDSNNGWDVTVYWDAEYGDTSANVYIQINQNSFGRTFGFALASNTANKYNSGASLNVGTQYYLYVYKNGTYNQKGGTLLLLLLFPLILFRIMLMVVLVHPLNRLRPIIKL